MTVTVTLSVDGRQSMHTLLLEPFHPAQRRTVITSLAKQTVLLLLLLLLFVVEQPME